MTSCQNTEVPAEVVEELQKFHDKLSMLEESLEKYVTLADAEKIELLDVLDRARLGLLTLYSTNSLFWIYLCTKGIKPAENESLKAELERIKEYMTKLKSIEDRVLAPKLNPRAAKAFVRNALFEPSPKENTDNDHCPSEEIQPENYKAEKQDAAENLEQQQGLVVQSVEHISGQTTLKAKKKHHRKKR